jgi:hypothetical protein
MIRIHLVGHESKIKIYASQPRGFRQPRGILVQCDISAPKRRAEEHVSAMLRGHDRRDDRAIFPGETIGYERVRSIAFQSSARLRLYK